MIHELKKFHDFLEKEETLSLLEIRAINMQRGRGEGNMVSWIVHQMR